MTGATRRHGRADRTAASGSLALLAAAFVACGGSSARSDVHPMNAPWSAKSAANAVDGGAAVASVASAASVAPASPASLAPAASALAPAVVDPFDDSHFATAARLDLDVIRQHPVGSRMAKVLAKVDPLFALATKASGIHPLADVDSVVWLGDGPARGANKIEIVTHHVAEPTMRTALVALAQKAVGPGAATALPTDPTQPFEAKVGARVVQAMQPAVGSVVFVPAGKMDTWTAAFPRDTFLRHSAAHEVFLLRVKDPGKSFSYVPKTVTTGRMEVDGKDDGGVEILIAAACADEAGAKTTAKAMADMIKQTNVFPIRLMTKNVLDTAKIAQTGSDVLVTIEATKAQVEALARIVADEMNADMD